MPWKRMLAYVTGEVEESLLLRIEYLVEENRVLRNQIQKRILLSDSERRMLAEKARRVQNSSPNNCLTLPRLCSIRGPRSRLPFPAFEPTATMRPEERIDPRNFRHFNPSPFPLDPLRATGISGQRETGRVSQEKWWRETESNCRHADFQSENVILGNRCFPHKNAN